MSNIKLLLNKTYLYLSQYPETELSQSELAEKIGCHRNTVSKELKEIQDVELIQLDNYYNEIDNKYLRAALILQDLGYSNLTNKEIARLLGVSEVTIGKYVKHTKLIG